MKQPIALTTLRYVSAIARHGSFSAAARACGVAQPTISNAIAELEATLGARLFERSTRRLAVTPAGDKLLPFVEGVTSAIAELEREALALKQPARQLLRIGFTSLLGAQRLGLLFGPFGAQHPAVETIYKECTQGDLEARLDASMLDFVCGTRLTRHRHRARQLLYREPLRWVAPNARPTGLRAVTLRDVARWPLLLTAGTCGLAPATRELFERARISIQPYAGEAISYAALEEWAELGIGGALIPESHIRRAPSTPLVEDGKPVQLVYEVVWRKDLLIARHALAFVGYLRTVVPGLVRGAAKRAT